MFLLSIVYVGSMYSKTSPGRILEDLADRHREAGVSPQMFDLWMESLLKTVEGYDPEFDPSVLHAWETVLRPGVAYMTSRCAE